MSARFICALVTGLTLSLHSPASAQTVFVEQGSAWTNDLRHDFYTQDQGARIMPLAWMQALKQADGTPFLADQLARYGYLPMTGRSDGHDLPVGFTTNDFGGTTAIGMTCAACHTRQIDVNGQAYRIDGGPAIVDFQSFLKDMDDATLAIVNDEAAFRTFAADVLGSDASPAKVNALKADLIVWSNRFHTLMERSLPDPAWAPARLDAVTMIFNRLTGLDIGPDDQNGLIPDNIKMADAPTRYPFLWNAAKQDFTQWPGFAANGNDLLGLSRNLGEVYGVFGEFRPTKERFSLFGYDYITNNSANFEGLKDLESWIWDIGAPKWQWEIDTSLVTEGEQIFNLATDAGGCVECHGKKRGKIRSPFHSTYATPIVDVGTDTRECQALAIQVDTGVLEGAKIPVIGKTLEKQAAAFDVLALSVIGAIAQNGTRLDTNEVDTTALLAESTVPSTASPDFLAQFQDLKEAFPVSPEGNEDLLMLTESVTDEGGCKYESRVLDGIWAAAPYLHNGSVPTLADLLKKPEDRPASFQPGPEYDIDNVGMVLQQSTFGQTIETTGCDDLNSGNSRCGHDFGTDLSDSQKKALIEYLKSI